ncbi:MAG: aminoacyl-tRNA hydrolase [Candidatus Omnitrophota bacterium]
MKLIVGLGNPGIFYSGTRHNVGFQVVKNLAGAQKAVLKKERGVRALSARAKVEGSDVILALPLTYMNLSGEAVFPLLNRYGSGPADLLVVCDDLDLEFGRIKIRSGGSSAGHRGIQSIIDSLGGNEFSRVRVGIGRPAVGAADYVLSHFNRNEKAALSAMINRAQECCLSWISQGVEKSMNIFNPKESKNE